MGWQRVGHDLMTITATERTSHTPPFPAKRRRNNAGLMDSITNGGISSSIRRRIWEQTFLVCASRVTPV